MALKASLLISGDASQAVAQLAAVDAALDQTAAAAKRASAANDDLGRKIDGTSRQAKAGYVNLGRQMQDVATQLAQPGVKLGTIVSQQGGQIADAVAQMGGRFAGLASFLAGPWGAAVIVATGVAINLADSLWKSADAADGNANALKGVEAASNGTAAAQSALGAMFDLSTGKIKANSAALAANIALQAAKLRADAVSARRDVNAALVQSGQASWRAAIANAGFGGAPGAPSAGSPDGNTVARARLKAVLDGKAGVKGGADLISWAEKADFSKLNIKREDFMSAVLRATELDPKTGLEANANAMLDSLRTGKLDPRFLQPKSGGRKKREPKGPNTGALAELGEDLGNKIAGIKDQFSDLPAVVAKSNAAMRQLDDVASDVERKKPPNYKQLISDIASAREVIENSLSKPLQDFLDKSREDAAVDELLIAGKRNQADALRIALSLQKQMGPLNKDQLASVLATVQAERERTEALQQQQDKINTYLDATRSVRSEIEAILSGSGKLSNFREIFKNLSGKVLAEKIFGAAFRDLDKWVQDESGVKDSATYLSTQVKSAGDAAYELAAALRGAGGQIAATPMENATARFGLDPAGSFETMAAAAEAKWQSEHSGEAGITVVGQRRDGERLSPSAYADQLGKKIAGPLTDGLNQIFGTKFFSRFEGTLGGAVTGYMTAGPLGAVLGGVKSITGLSQSMAGKLDGALKGAQTGTMVAGVANAFGVKLSGGGAQLGGAVGSFLPIPGGQVIGAIAGGLIGKLFGGGAKWGTQAVGSVGKAGGNSTDMQGNVGGAAGSIADSLASIAERLGGSVGSYSVSIGQMDNKWRVSTSGRTGKLENKYGDVTNFGQDGDAALKFALVDAIKDGAITGVSEAVKRALASSGDAEKALSEALKVQDLEKLLGGIGGEINKAFADFERQAKERLRIASQYGFDVVKVEERNAQDRLKLSQQLLDQQVGSLQRLIDEMTSGSLFEGSAVDQRSAILADIDKAKAGIAAGTEGAADKLAGLFERLNAVSKDIYGTTGGFAADRTTILDQARDVIAQANQRIADAQAKSDPALAATNAALDENNDQNAQIIALLRELGGASPQAAPGVSNLAGLARIASTRELQ